MADFTEVFSIHLMFFRLYLGEEHLSFVLELSKLNNIFVVSLEFYLPGIEINGVQISLQRGLTDF